MVAPSSLAPGDVHVLSVDLDAGVDVDRLRDHLSPDELARAARFRFARDRARFVVARGVLREVAGAQLGVTPARVAFAEGPHGKPALAEPAAGAWLRFNVSHSDGLVLLAFARDREVGIDVERMRENVADVGLARRFFSAREQAALAPLEGAARRALFFRIWSCKEAFVKATGEGVARGLGGFDVVTESGDVCLRTDDVPADATRWTLRALPAPAGYAAAVVAESDAGASPRLLSASWTP